jgi:chemotaxis protein MotA
MALESKAKAHPDPFTRKGLTRVVDGIDPAMLLSIMETELETFEEHSKIPIPVMEGAGAYAPTIGIIGTVMGLVHVLGNLSSPEELGPLIASAFVATLWGVMSANVLWLPISNRLKRLSGLEAARMELTIEGVSAIQSGSNPRLVAQKLRSLLPADQQVEEEAA